VKIPPNDRDLQKLMLFYKAQADRCGKTKAFFAGCLCLGSALEAGLLAMAGCFEEEVREAQTFRKASKKDLRKWNLDDLLMLASELKWIPSQIAKFRETARAYDVHPDEALKKGDLAYFARMVKDIRNTIHPGNYLRKWRGTYLGKRYYEFCYTIAELVFDHLGARLEESIAQQIPRD